jgi:hypothetical protein
VTLQQVDGKLLIPDDERHSAYLAQWLNSIIPYRRFDYAKCTKITMLLTLPSHCPPSCTFQTSCLRLSRADTLHFAVIVTDMLLTNTLELLHIQNIHECHPLPRYHTRDNLISQQFT